MNLTVIVALAFGILIVLLCVAGGFWYSRRVRGQLEGLAQAHNRTMQALATELGFTLQSPPSYEHAQVGRLSTWASIAGDLDGQSVVIGADFEGGGEGAASIATRARYRAPQGRRFSVESRRGKVTFKLPKQRDQLARAAPSVPAPVLLELAALAERIEVTPSETVVTARPTPGQRSSLSYAPRLVLELESLLRLVRAAAALAAKWETHPRGTSG